MTVRLDILYAELQKKYALLARKYNQLLVAAVKNRNTLKRLLRSYLTLKKKYLVLRKHSTKQLTSLIDHINNEKYQMVFSEYRKLEKVSAQFLDEIEMTGEEFANSMYVDILFDKYLPQPDRSATATSTPIQRFTFPVLLKNFETDEGPLHPFVHFTIQGKIARVRNDRTFHYFLNIENVSSSVELEYFQKTDSLYQSVSVTNFKLLNAKKTIEMHKRMLLSLTCSLVGEYSKETSDHLKNMELLTGFLSAECARLGLIKPENYDLEEYVKDINYTSVLHDVGKMSVPSAILEKNETLTADEHQCILGHPAAGASYIRHIMDMFAQDPQYASYCNFLQIPYEICLYHHERWDGTGYPDALTKEAIPIAARIVSVTDTYEGLRGIRCYNHQRKSHVEAVEIITGQSGKQFDPQIVQAFVNISYKFESLFI